jgi:hypothetical protein
LSFPEISWVVFDPCALPVLEELVRKKARRPHWPKLLKKCKKRSAGVVNGLLPLPRISVFANPAQWARSFRRKIRAAIR